MWKKETKERKGRDRKIKKLVQKVKERIARGER